MSLYTNPVSRNVSATPAISVAPMMDWTDRNYRYFARLLAPDALLYTEMITANAVIRGDRDYLLGFDESEHPVAAQLGGDDPDLMAEAAGIVTDYGYDEININVGCPSDKVREGNFGACLMADPALVARLVEAMRRTTHLPVTVKHRIGIRGQEEYEDMLEFVDTVRQAGPARFTVHARIAVLEGLSPKENRTVPPLRYEDVYRLKQERPDIDIEINGGIKTVAATRAALSRLDGVMLGRAAYETPEVLAALSRDLFGGEPPVFRDVIMRMGEYAAERQGAAVAPRHIFRHMLHLFAGVPGSRRYRQVLSGRMAPDADPREILLRSVERLPSDVLDRQVGADQISSSLISCDPTPPVGAAAQQP